MKGRIQAIIAFGTLSLALAASGIAAQGPAFHYQSPKIAHPLFDKNLTMLDRERGEYATNLSTYAANLVAEQNASKESLAKARRLLALAMQLDPRNRKALVVDFQLQKGVLPEKSKSTYTAGALARLLFARAELLKREADPQNKFLARAFIELAAEMDPHNEDAVYACALQRREPGPFDWSRITDTPAPKPPAVQPSPPPAE
jgi:hypothetical protein